MKKLTKGQRKALAREARRLAMECVEGTQPPLTPDSFCGCAIGEMVRRTFHLERLTYFHERYELTQEIDNLLSEPANVEPWGGIVSIALKDHGPQALPFPLLALADELEASAASARKRPQKQSPAVP